MSADRVLFTIPCLLLPAGNTEILYHLGNQIIFDLYPHSLEAGEMCYGPDFFISYYTLE